MAQQALDEDPVLRAMAAADRLPIVPFTEEEKRLLAEVDPNEPYIPHAEIARRIAARADAEPDE